MENISRQIILFMANDSNIEKDSMLWERCQQIHIPDILCYMVFILVNAG
jgi:hypothetical protein